MIIDLTDIWTNGSELQCVTRTTERPTPERHLQIPPTATHLPETPKPEISPRPPIPTLPAQHQHLVHPQPPRPIQITEISTPQKTQTNSQEKTNP